MPYAIECQGNIIQLYDPIYHNKVEDETRFMCGLVGREAAHAAGSRQNGCQPFIITGGELTLEMLDLSFNKGPKSTTGGEGQRVSI